MILGVPYFPEENPQGREYKPLYRIFAWDLGYALAPGAVHGSSAAWQRGLPRAVRHGSIGRCTKSEEKTARGINDGTIAMRIETSEHISRCRPLCTVARHQKDGVRHQGPQRPGLLWICGPTTAPQPNSRSAHGSGPPCFDKLAKMFIERSAGPGNVLELARRGIGRFHEHEQAATVLLRLVDERRDPVTPQKALTVSASTSKSPAQSARRPGWDLEMPA